MTKFICPKCGSQYFLVSRIGRKDVFQVVDGRTVQFMQASTEKPDPVIQDTDTIYCGACSWQGYLNEVVASHLD